MLKTILVLFLITLIPGLELRASIPIGFFGNEQLAILAPWPVVALICTLANILIGMGVYLILDPCVRFFRHVGCIDRLLTKFLDRAQKKLAPSVQKYGFWGVAVFIGIPLPLTGAYTGAAGAYVLGMKKRQFFLANAVGVCMAAVIVTAICLLIKAGCSLPFFHFLIKH